MKRRQFLAVSMTGFVGAIAGCSDTDNSTPTGTSNLNETETPTETPTDETPTDETPTETTEGSVPQDMVAISQFAFNKHQKNAKSRPYTASITTESGQGSQTIDFVYNGEDKSLFTVESVRSGETTTVERFSAYGFMYTRMNPPNEEIKYSKQVVPDGEEAYVHTGIKIIDQLTNSNAEVSEPKEQEKTGVFRYTFTNHGDYDTVSGYIELDVQRGVITEVKFTSDSYTIDMEFTFGGQTVTKPSWVEDMNDDSSA